MKIPAHFLSPAAINSKGAHNAPLQSVAEFLNEQSETPKDFFSALKSLQNLVKPQKANEQQIGAGQDTASLGAKSVATKVAELKFTDPKIEKMEPHEPDLDAPQELSQAKDDGTLKLNEAEPSIKTASVERSALLDDITSGPGLLKNASDTEQLPVSSDEVELASMQSGRVDASPANNIGTKSPATIEAIDKSLPHSRANINPTMDSSSSPNSAIETNASFAEHKTTELSSLGLNTRPGADTGASIAQAHRPALTIEKNSRRTDSPRLEIDRAAKGRTKSVDLAPIKQNDIVAKGEARVEIPGNPRSGQTEEYLDSKPSLDNAPQIQVKGATAPQTTATNMQAVQTAPLVAAKEISAQVTRHLNSELLNMDLRTQIVSERATTGALNSSVLTLQLHPIGLGRVQAEIRKEGDLVRIKLTVEAKGTFDILKNDIDALKAAMRALGTAEGDVTLTQGNINRLPNDAANNGQNFFSNERDAQSELRGRQDQDPNGRSEQQSGSEDNAPRVRSSDQTLQDANNTVFI